MRAIHMKKTKATAATLALLVGGGVAVAYWTGGGSGTGTATTANSASVLTVNQEPLVDQLAPGKSAQTLNGTFNNATSGATPVYVSTVTASISGVTKAVGAPAGTCTATDYTLASPVMTVNAQIPTGTNVGAWTGATLEFNNKSGVNQDACKGATVTLSYTIA